MPRIPDLTLCCAAVIAGVLLVACGSSSSTTTQTPTVSTGIPVASSASGATAIPPEQNPPGDIPDDQAFVSYHSSGGGYTLDVPEGWARTESGPNVEFVSKLDAVAVEVTSASVAPTVESVTANELPLVEAKVEAFDKVLVQAASLPSGNAVLVRYRANSAPDAVTGKKVRLEIDRYEVYKDGQVAAVSLSAPAGSDNVDVWKKISNGFKWD